MARPSSKSSMASSARKSATARRSAPLRTPNDIPESKRRDIAGGLATTSLIGNWVDEAEARVWFLFEASRR